MSQEITDEYRNEITEKIISQLEEVYDPEIPINIYDLGLIYKITLTSSNSCHILMTLTSPTCPTAEYIQAMVEEAATNVLEIDECDVELTFEPRWNPEMVSQEVREEMGFIVQDSDTAPEHVKTSMKEHENLQLQETFKGVNQGRNSNVGREEGAVRVCFNCSITEDKLPLLQGVYKGRDVFICTKCIMKYQ
ncbi:MAG: iron-sulfur cluster assembly protein [Nanoarchaeota archaeon]|nr:iron-sulfur cluster assembly protein [Nanoarchaeota archaeon]